MGFSGAGGETLTCAFGYRVGEVAIKTIDEMSVDCDYSLPVAGLARQRMVVMVSLGCHCPGAVPPAPDRQDRLSLIAGACKRLTPRLLQPEDEFLAFCRQNVAGWLQRFFPDPIDPEDPLDFDEWLASRKSYSEARKAQIRLARESFEPRNAFVAKAFVKSETYQDFKYPRWICPLDDYVKAWCGPVAHAIEELVFSSRRFVKKIPSVDRVRHLQSQFDRLAGDVLVASDITSMEAHHNSLIGEFKMEMYRHFLGAHPDRDQYLDMQRMLMFGPHLVDGRTVETEVGVRAVDPAAPVLSNNYFTIRNVRCLQSGKNETSLENGLLNVFWFDMGRKYFFDVDFEFDNGIFEGDDSLVRAESNRVLTEACYARMGVRAKPVVAYNLPETDFCGMVFSDDGIVTTDVRYALAGFGWAGDNYLRTNRVRRLELLRAKSFSMLYQYTHCPLLHALALYGLRVTRGIEVTRLFRKRNHVSLWDLEQYIEAYEALKHKKVFPQNTGIRTRLLVEERFGVTVEQQFDAEERLSRMNVLQPLDFLPVSIFPDSWTLYADTYLFDVKRSQVLSGSVPDLTLGRPHQVFSEEFWANHSGQFHIGPKGKPGSISGRDAVFQGCL